MLLAVFWGVISGLFVKYAFDYVFPKPDDENGDNLNKDSSSELSKTKEAN